MAREMATAAEDFDRETGEVRWRPWCEAAEREFRAERRQVTRTGVSRWESMPSVGELVILLARGHRWWSVDSTAYELGRIRDAAASD